MRIVAVALFATLALAGDPDIDKQTKPITVNLDNVGPETAARMLRRVADLRVEFAPQAAEKRANIRLINVPTATAMKSIAEHFVCEVQYLGKRRWRVAPAWQFAIFRALESNRVASPRSRMPLEQILELVRAQTQLDITLDREVDPELEITMTVSGTTCDTLLDRLVKRARLKWEPRYGVVYIAKPERLRKMPVLPPRLESPALRGKRTPVDFDRVPLGKLAPIVTQWTGVPFIVPKEMLAREVSAHAKDVSLRQALALLLYPGGMTVVEKDGALHVEALPAH